MRLSSLAEALRPTGSPAAKWFNAGQPHVARSGSGWKEIDGRSFDPAFEYYALFEDLGQQYLVGFTPIEFNEILITFIFFTPTKNEGAAPSSMSRTGHGRPFTILNAVTALAGHFISVAEPDVIGFAPVDAQLARVDEVIIRRNLRGYERVPVQSSDWLYAKPGMDVSLFRDYPVDGIAH